MLIETRIAPLMKMCGQMLSLSDLTGHKDKLIKVKASYFAFFFTPFIICVQCKPTPCLYMYYAFKNVNKGCDSNGYTVTN